MKLVLERRWLVAGARAQAGEDQPQPGDADDVVDIDLDAETMARRQRLMGGGATSPRCDVVSSMSSINTALLEQPQPRSRQVATVD